MPRAVSTAKSFGGALTQTFKSMIPGIAEAEAYVSQFNGVAPALSFAAFALGESAKSAAAQGSAYLGQAYTALAAPVEVGAGGTAAVTGLAVVAAAGSVTLAGVTIHGAATGDVNESPVDVADKSLGTGFGDLYGWSQRSWVGFAVAYSSPIGWLAIGANKLAGY